MDTYKVTFACEGLKQHFLKSIELGFNTSNITWNASLAKNKTTSTLLDWGWTKRPGGTASQGGQIHILALLGFWALPRGLFSKGEGKKNNINHKVLACGTISSHFAEKFWSVCHINGDIAWKM